MDEVTLLIRGEQFIVKKDVLCEHSDYFGAMFSGNYIEKEQREIVIDVLQPSIMHIIIQYMNMGLIDLLDHSLQVISELAMAANFLQISELIKQIEYTLELNLSMSNWMDTLVIAENAAYMKLEQIAAAFGLFSFKYMKTGCISSINKLFWYLSHPYLDRECELDVFKFGLEWLLNNKTGANAIMIILGCLDLTKVSSKDLLKIKSLMIDYINSLPSKVVDCLYESLTTGHELSAEVLCKQREGLCQKFTKRIYDETYNLVTESKLRKLQLTLAIPMTINDPLADESPHYIYTYSPNSGCDKWLELVEKNLWGWSVTSYNCTKLVVVCGEYGRGTGKFMRDVKVYDTLKKEWNRHGVQLPCRRHGSVVILGDSLYIIGGVGAFRILLDTAIIYNLREKTYRNIAKIPDTVQDPAICCHENAIYVAGCTHIYKYEESENTDYWTPVARVKMSVKCMVSHNGYIYCTQSYFCELYKLSTNNCELQLVIRFVNVPTAMCSLSGHLIALTENKLFKDTDILSVEEYVDTENAPKVLFTKKDASVRINETAGCCVIVTNVPPLEKSIGQYHMRYLMGYPEIM